jgi:hypothetical protein
MGGDQTLSEALKQALKLKAAKAAAGPPPRLRGVKERPSERRLRHLIAAEMKDLFSGIAGPLATLEGTAGTDRMRRTTRARETSKFGVKRGLRRHHPNPSICT